MRRIWVNVRPARGGGYRFDGANYPALEGCARSPALARDAARAMLRGLAPLDPRLRPLPELRFHILTASHLRELKEAAHRARKASARERKRPGPRCVLCGGTAEGGNMVPEYGSRFEPNDTFLGAFDTPICFDCGLMWRDLPTHEKVGMAAVRKGAPVLDALRCSMAEFPPPQVIAWAFEHRTAKRRVSLEWVSGEVERWFLAWALAHTPADLPRSFKDWRTKSPVAAFVEEHLAEAVHHRTGEKRPRQPDPRELAHPAPRGRR